MPISTLPIIHHPPEKEQQKEPLFYHVRSLDHEHFNSKHDCDHCLFPPRRLPDGFWPEKTALKPSANVSMTSAIMYWISWTIQRAGAQSLPSGSLTWLAPRMKRVDRVEVVEGCCCWEDIFVVPLWWCDVIDDVDAV
jgi:hypothetical protein